MKTFYAIIVTLSALFSLSCTAQVDGRLSQDGSAQLTLSAGLAPRMALLLSQFSAKDESGLETLIDARTITSTLQKSPGIYSIQLKNKDYKSLDGSIQISDIDLFLSTKTTAEGGKPFAQYERSTIGGRLVISLDRTSGPPLLSQFSPEVVEYLSALMAPIATSEALTEQEYLDLVTSVYGKGIADEIQEAHVPVAIEVPGLISSVYGGNYSKKIAHFHIPLINLLVLENPIHYAIQWK